MLREEGIEFITSTDVGQDVSIEDLRANADAVVLTLGSTVPRDLRIPNREAGGIHFAMEFLTKNQKRLMMTRDGKLESGWDRSFITAEGKDVIVVGGGDTGTVSRRAFPLLSLVVRGRVDTPILGRRQEGRTEQGELDATNPQRCSPPPPPRTASARRCGTAASPSSTSSSCPGRPTSARPTTRGRSGPRSTAWTTATPRSR